MKRITALLIASAAFVGWLEDPAHSMPTQAECLAVNDRLQAIAHAAGTEAVEIDAIKVHGVSHVAGTHAKEFEEARAAAVNALMDFLAATDGLARQFQAFCGRE